MKKVFFSFIFISILSISCNTNQQTKDLTIDNTIAMQDITLSSAQLDTILLSIPQPAEITAIIKTSGAIFSPMVIIETDNLKYLTDSYEKAINLGMYGADFSYINIYAKTELFAMYLDAIKKLADDLNLGNLFDAPTINKLANDFENPDTIIHLATTIFKNMDKYLKENKKDEISTLILFGGWLEAVHIATSVMYNSKLYNQNLINKIAHQKIVLDNFLILMKHYSAQPFFQNLITELEHLQTIYNDVIIVKQENQLDETTKVLALVADSAFPVIIKDTELAKITIANNALRKKLIQPQVKQ